ncbi:MAG: sugar ABC transporter substrate-binding protein, partial [Clostridia bacterium]|nr:sugar ABC transporter substrate-binding protein [Clostridia bacterium]
MKKVFACLMMAVLLLGCLSALADGPVTITFWDENAGPNRTPYYEELIAKFETLHPEIHVEYVGLPWSDAKSKYDVAIQSKTTPDCGGVSQDWICDFIIKNALVPIDTYFDNWSEKDDLVASYITDLHNMAPDGKLYAILNTANIPVLWYRADRIAQPITWDDVFAEAEESTDLANNIYGFSIRGGSGSTRLLEQMIYSYSGITEMFDENGKSTVNDPLHVEFVEKLASMYNRLTPESDITNGYKEMVAAFDTGVANMICHNLGSYGEHSQTLEPGQYMAATGLKSKKGNANVVTNGSICYSIFNTSEHPEEAFTFISYLCEAEQNSFWNEKVGQLPTSKKALESDYAKNAQHIADAAATTADPTTTVVCVPIWIPGYSDMMEELIPKFQQVLLGEMSAQT